MCVCVFQRDEEIARRQAVKEKKKKEREDKLKDSMQMYPEPEEEEEEEELPHIYIPEHPSPLFCGFYSQPGQFWLSMVHTNTQLYLYEHATTITRMFRKIKIGINQQKLSRVANL